MFADVFVRIEIHECGFVVVLLFRSSLRTNPHSVLNLTAAGYLLLDKYDSPLRIFRRCSVEKGATVFSE
jgi:hypothetical protein